MCWFVCMRHSCSLQYQTRNAYIQGDHILALPIRSVKIYFTRSAFLFRRSQTLYYLKGEELYTTYTTCPYKGLISSV